MQALEVRPEYRTLVRRALPIGLQDAYWDHCFEETEGTERYLHPCPLPEGMSDVAPAVISRVLEDASILSALREWTSVARLTGDGLVRLQPAMAARIVATIDESEIIR